MAALHLAAAAPERTVAEYWEDESPLINIVKGVYPKVVDGHVHLGEEPGLGVTLDEGMLDRIAVETVTIDKNTPSIAQ
jgi:L-alanine-DL-glutamate epimerase-like enolase superfamily enzyme